MIPLLISFIIPTYNRAHLIGQTLDSVLAQSYENWECIIVDDGSQDNSSEIIKKYSEMDSRIKYFNRPLDLNKGASSCRNFGFKKSKGAFIQYLDSDDLISHHKISNQITDIENYPTYTLSCCDWSLFNSDISKDQQRINLPFNNDLVSPCSFLKKMGETNTFYPIHSYLVPRKVIVLAGDWNENLTNNDDAEFFTRVILNSTNVKHLNKKLAYYRRSGPSNLSSYSDESKISSVIKSWELIEGHLTLSCAENSLIYVENAKYRLFQTIKNRYAYLAAQNSIFFSKEFEQEPHRLKNTFIFQTILLYQLYLFKKDVKKKIKKWVNQLFIS